ncbi:MAG: hypothetical protein ACYC91_13755 [Solirubrobacteraceae bacterium]
MALAGCGSSSSPGYVHHPPRRALESIFEDEGMLHSNPAAALDTFKRLGVSRVRVYVAWEAFASSPSSRRRPPGFASGAPGAYPASGFSVLDEIIRDAAARGVGIDLTIGGPAPLWATGSGVPHSHPSFPQAWKPSAAAFGTFVRLLAVRYNGTFRPAPGAPPLPRVGFWSIWNEPNYGPDLAPQAIDHSTVETSPALYRGLLDAAWRALTQTDHGGDTVLIGETAPRGITTGDNPGNFSGMVPLRFIRALYCVDASLHPLRGGAATLRGCPARSAGSANFPHRHPALFQAGGFADHPYPQGGLAPNVTTPDEPDYADLAALPNLERTLDGALAAYGSHRRLPIYSTEFGYQTDPPEKIAHTTDPVTAARYLNWSEYISWLDPRVRSYDQYLLADPPGANALGGFATGLEFANGTPKATLDAYRMPLYLPRTSFRSGQPVEIWGAARPARYAQLHSGRAQRVQIEFAAGSSLRFQNLRTVLLSGPGAYFDLELKLPASGTVRLGWSPSGGAEIHSRPVSVTAN